MRLTVALAVFVLSLPLGQSHAQGSLDERAQYFDNCMAGLNNSQYKGLNPYAKTKICSATRFDKSPPIDFMPNMFDGCLSTSVDKNAGMVMTFLAVQMCACIVENFISK